MISIHYDDGKLGRLPQNANDQGQLTTFVEPSRPGRLRGNWQRYHSNKAFLIENANEVAPEITIHLKTQK